MLGKEGTMRFLNTILNRFMIGANVVLFVAYIIFAKMQVISDKYLHLLLGASAISIIVYVIADRKLLDSPKLKYVVLAFNYLIWD